MFLHCMPFIVYCLVNGDLQSELTACKNDTSGENGICLEEKLCLGPAKGLNIGACGIADSTDVCCKMSFKAVRAGRSYNLKIEPPRIQDEQTIMFNNRKSASEGYHLLYIDWTGIYNDTIRSDSRKGHVHSDEDDSSRESVQNDWMNTEELDETFWAKYIAGWMADHMARKNYGYSPVLKHPKYGINQLPQGFRHPTTMDELSELYDSFPANFGYKVSSEIWKLENKMLVDAFEKVQFRLLNHASFDGEFAKCANITPSNRHQNSSKYADSFDGSSLEARVDVWKNSSEVCGKPVKQEILGSKTHKKNEVNRWPWMASVHEYSLDIYRHKCAAALLTNSWVITNAQCVYSVPAVDLIVRVGVHDVGPKTDLAFEDRHVDKIVIHPLFNRTSEHAIALLRMEHRVEYSAYISPICLPRNIGQLEGDMAVVLGWMQKYDVSVWNALYELSASIQLKRECQAYHEKYKHMNRDDFLCASIDLISNFSSEICVGDRNNQLVNMDKDGRWTLIGLSPLAVGCLYDKVPGIFTSISSYQQWIEDTISCFER